jgi:hypothetical protein
LKGTPLIKNLYLFSGLGADKRIFQRLDLSGYAVNYIEWILPLEGETIEQYASRLLCQITAPNPTLIGLSFGGIMAIEVAKLMGIKPGCSMEKPDSPKKSDPYSRHRRQDPSYSIYGL